MNKIVMYLDFCEINKLNPSHYRNIEVFNEAIGSRELQICFGLYRNSLTVEIKRGNIEDFNFSGNYVGHVIKELKCVKNKVYLTLRP